MLATKEKGTAVLYPQPSRGKPKAGKYAIGAWRCFNSADGKEGNVKGVSYPINLCDIREHRKLERKENE